MPRYWVETLGCPKNQVDSDKVVGRLEAEGHVRAGSAAEADLVVVNTCAFIEAARQESVETVLALAAVKADGARLVVTGCMAERYGSELADALPEVDLVAGFGVPVTLGRRGAALASDEGHRHGPGTFEDGAPIPLLDLLNLPRPRSAAPWAYVKIAEGCDRSCGFCAIPSFRGPQRSRTVEAILAEVDALEAKEIVLVAQDLASYGRDVAGMGAGSIVGLVERVADRVERTRLLYLYPSDLSDGLIDVIGSATGVPYFDLSLQHVSKRLLRGMRRWGDGGRFLDRIADIRVRFPGAAFRSNFIVGYPGETESDHDQLLDWLGEARLDWCGFFTYSQEEGTHAAHLPGSVPAGLAVERHRELTEVQDRITSSAQAAQVGRVHRVLVDAPGVGRSHREAPEIDGLIHFGGEMPVGAFVDVRITGLEGPDLVGEAVGSRLGRQPTGGAGGDRGIRG